jgi:hypothetical protein
LLGPESINTLKTHKMSNSMRVKDSTLAVVMGLPAVQVAVRIRDDACNDSNGKRRVAAVKLQQASYAFDHAYDSRTTQRYLYYELLSPLVTDFLQVSLDLAKAWPSGRIS